ncbi:MAG: carboxypeptidase-like regulatory domain-containing protein [Gemmatimonadaceae bacterium]
MGHREEVRRGVTCDKRTTLASLASLASRASRRLTAALALAVLGVLGARAADGQVVRGSVVDSASGAPLVDAIVTLQREGSGDAPRRARVDATGRFELLAPGPGDLVVVARAVGYAMQQRRVSLRAAQAERLDIALSRNVVRVAGVQVTERNECTSPEALAAGGAALWSDVWTALTSAQLTVEPVTAAGVMRYRRELSPGSGLVRGEARQLQRGRVVAPFMAAEAAALARDGFARESRDGGLELFAPDAATVTSNDFVRLHCFAVTTSDTSRAPQRVGLRFWPRRDFTSRGIDGVFWLDAATRELQEITFGFPLLAAVGVPADSLGGIVRFAHRPGGSWYVSRWYLRLPVLLRSVASLDWRGRPSDEGRREALVAVSEEGGVVFEDSSGAPLSRVRGEVVTSDGHIVPGADVEFLGADVRTRTDAAGIFSLSTMLPGHYVVRVTAPGSDSATTAFHHTSVRVADQREAPALLVLPSPRAQASAVCEGRRRSQRDTLALVGMVRDGDRPAVARRLEARWMELSTEGAARTLRGRSMLAEFSTDSLGIFRICAVSPRASVSFRRAGGGESDWSWPVTLGATLSVLRLTIDTTGRIADVVGAKSASVAQAQLQEERGAAVRMTGVVRTADSSGVAMGDVEVQLDADSASVVRTDSAGAFSFDGVTRGVHVVTARRLGFAPERHVVVIGGAPPSPIELRLQRAQRLARVLVEGESAASAIANGAFEARRTAGFGVFIGPEEMAARRGRSTLTNIIMSKVPGLEAIPLYRGTMSAGFGIASRRFRSLGGGSTQVQPCFSQVFVDGSRASGMRGEAFDLEQMAALDIAAIEVYRGASETPNEFNGPSAACGTVVIWTRKR